jgi:hypothetical protein
VKERPDATLAELSARYHKLESAVVAALSAITLDDILGWFRHCGY